LWAVFWSSGPQIADLLTSHGCEEAKKQTFSEKYVVGYASNPLNIDDYFRVGRARGYCNDYEDEDDDA